MIMLGSLTFPADSAAAVAGNFGRIAPVPDFMKLIVNSNEHAPGTFRAIGAPSNMPAFATAFGCKVGAPMAPKNACSVW